MIKLKEKHKKDFENYFKRLPPYIKIKGKFREEEGVFIKSKYGGVFFLTNSCNIAGSSSDDKEARPRAHGYHYSWSFITDTETELFAPQYLYDTEISTLSTKLKLKTI